MSSSDLGWIGEALNNVRSRRPLVHNITNFVVMNTTANALLALGASPIMSHAIEDLDDLVPSADVLVVNIGTLDEEFIYSMLKAVQIAKAYNKPVVLDPVGAGATKLRTRTALMLVENGRISVIRGNFGEILALAGEFGKTKGVDSAAYDERRAMEVALEVASRFNSVVGVTGPIDYVSDGKKVVRVGLRTNSQHLSKVIGRVTGLGCIVTALIGAFLAVEDPLKACIAGIAVFKAAAFRAAEEAPYPGSFHVKLYDWLYRLNGSDVSDLIEVSNVGL